MNNNNDTNTAMETEAEVLDATEQEEKIFTTHGNINITYRTNDLAPDNYTGEKRVVLQLVEEYEEMVEEIKGSKDTGEDQHVWRKIYNLEEVIILVKLINPSQRKVNGNQNQMKS